MSKRTHRSGALSSRALQPLDYPGGPESGAMGHRQERLEHILLDEIQTLIRDEAADPALEGVRLVSVRLSVDGGHALPKLSFEFVGIHEPGSAGPQEGGEPWLG